MYVQRNKESRSCNHCCRGKSASIAYYEYVFVSLVIQHAMCMRHIAIRVLSGSTVLFHIISLTARFSKNVTEHKMCFDFLYNVCLKHAIVRRTARDMIKNVYCSSYAIPVYLSDFNETLISSTDFRKNTQISNFTKICPVRAEYHADGRTDTHDKANGRFSQFSERA